jgi:hypothetical protein
MNGTLEELRKSLMDEPNLRLINDPAEALQARWLARREFMARLAPTGFTVKKEYQDRWWGFVTDEKPRTMLAKQTR